VHVCGELGEHCAECESPTGLVPSGAAGVSRYVSATQQARKQRLSGYGNAVVPPVAATFVRAFVAARNDAQQG